MTMTYPVNPSALLTFGHSTAKEVCKTKDVRYYARLIAVLMTNSNQIICRIVLLSSDLWSGVIAATFIVNFIYLFTFTYF